MDLEDYKELKPENYEKCLPPALVELLKRLSTARLLFSCYRNPVIPRKDKIVVKLSLPIYTEEEEGSGGEKLENDFILLDAGVEILPKEKNLEFTPITEVNGKTSAAVWTFICSRYYKANWLPRQVYLVTSSGCRWRHKTFAISNIEDIINALVVSEEEAINYCEEKKKQHRRNIAALKMLN